MLLTHRLMEHRYSGLMRLRQCHLKSGLSLITFCNVVLNTWTYRQYWLLCVSEVVVVYTGPPNEQTMVQPLAADSLVWAEHYYAHHHNPVSVVYVCSSSIIFTDDIWRVSGCYCVYLLCVPVAFPRDSPVLVLEGPSRGSPQLNTCCFFHWVPYHKHRTT